MTPEMIQAIVQLGFAAAVAAYLVYYQTTALNESIKANTKAVIGMQLLITELYFLMLQHDAQVRSITDATDKSDIAAAAKASYDAACGRLEQLQAKISAQLVEPRR